MQVQAFPTEKVNNAAEAPQLLVSEKLQQFIMFFDPSELDERLCYCSMIDV